LFQISKSQFDHDQKEEEIGINNESIKREVSGSFLGQKESFAPNSQSSNDIMNGLTGVDSLLIE